jgi:predicted CxxxxCH...CXXCH cytochrome family protein
MLPAFCEVIDGPFLYGVEFNPFAHFKDRMPGSADTCDAVNCHAPATAACDPYGPESTWLLYLCDRHRETYRSHYHC